jgi:uncharacterized damage-inducible protein DinB
MTGTDLKETLRLFDYHGWANERMFRRLHELPPETVHEPLTNVFPSVHEALVHMYRVDTVWYYAMSGRGAEIMARAQQIIEETKGLSAAAMHELFSDLFEEIRGFLARQESDPVQPYPHPQYGTLHASYADIVRHIVNHGTYHRGNVTAMLRQMGHAGAATDYVFFMYEFPAITE